MPKEQLYFQPCLDLSAGGTIFSQSYPFFIESMKKRFSAGGYCYGLVLAWCEMVAQRGSMLDEEGFPKQVVAKDFIDVLVADNDLTDDFVKRVGFYQGLQRMDEALASEGWSYDSGQRTKLEALASKYKRDINECNAIAIAYNKLLKEVNELPDDDRVSVEKKLVLLDKTGKLEIEIVKLWTSIKADLQGIEQLRLSSFTSGSINVTQCDGDEDDNLRGIVEAASALQETASDDKSDQFLLISYSCDDDPGHIVSLFYSKAEGIYHFFDPNWGEVYVKPDQLDEFIGTYFEVVAAEGNKGLSEPVTLTQLEYKPPRLDERPDADNPVGAPSFDG